MVTLIAALASNKTIDFNQQFSEKLPFNLKWFQMHTANGVVIMNQQMFESSFASEPLPSCLNIILSNGQLPPDKLDVIWVSCMSEAIDVAGNRNTFIIGNGKILDKSLHSPFITRTILTYLQLHIDGSKTLTLPHFTNVYKSKVFTENEIQFHFEISKRI
jgi:dihydrofolate reductase|tara:strand:+ start:5688 stop:6167 length:480 start_codon:yes stop_codon:yes gene_type:complete